jgi:peptide/nickel transport system substrate-binding protein
VIAVRACKERVMETYDNYWRPIGELRLRRRRFLTAMTAGGLGLIGASLIGCGSDSKSSSSTVSTPAGTGAGTVAAAAGGQPRRGGTLTINGTNFSKLEAVTGTGGNDHQYLWAVFDNLVGYERDFAPDPKRSLAQAWENPDPLTWIFKLRPGVRFHDGTAFDAEAVRANFAYATDPGVASNVKSDLQAIAGVEVRDAMTAVYKLKTPAPGLLATLGDRAGFISSPAAITKWGKDYGLHPVGTGPFIHEEFVKDSGTKVKRNPEYWGKDDAGNSLPYLEGIYWRNVDQPAAQVAALKTGELNVLWNMPAQFIKELQGDAKLQLLNEPGAGGSFFYMNHTRPPFNNVHLRRAAAFSFAREPIINTVYFGAAVPALGNIGPAHWAYDPKQKRQTLDPQIVKDSLQRAGMSNGFSYEMSVSSDPATVQEGELIQASAKQFGIDVKLRALGTPDFYLKYIEEGFADAMNAGLSARADPTIYFKFNYHSTGTYRKTVTGELDPEIDALAQIADRDELKRKISTLQQKLNDDAYSGYIRHANTVVAAQKKVHFVVFADGKPHLGFGDVWVEA